MENLDKKKGRNWIYYTVPTLVIIPLLVAIGMHYSAPPYDPSRPGGDTLSERVNRQYSAAVPYSRDSGLNMLRGGSAKAGAGGSSGDQGGGTSGNTVLPYTQPERHEVNYEGQGGGMEPGGAGTGSLGSAGSLTSGSRIPGQPLGKDNKGLGGPAGTDGDRTIAASGGGTVAGGPDKAAGKSTFGAEAGSSGGPAGGTVVVQSVDVPAVQGAGAMQGEKNEKPSLSGQNQSSGMNSAGGETGEKKEEKKAEERRPIIVVQQVTPPAAAKEEVPSDNLGIDLREPTDPSPMLFVWPRELDFGDLKNFETTSRLIAVMNIGTLNLRLGKIENLDSDTPFFIMSDACSSKTLAPGKSCWFEVRYTPKAAYQYGSALEVPSNDPTLMPFQNYVKLTGSAVQSPWDAQYKTACPTAQCGASSVNFGWVPAGKSLLRGMRVTNDSKEAWTNVTLNLSKLPAAVKVSNNGCAAKTLNPGGSCFASLTLTPTTADNKRLAGADYGSYIAIDLSAGNASVVSPMPRPPLVLDRPVTAGISGEVGITADTKSLGYRKNVQTITVKGLSSADFPVNGLVRVQKVYFFRKSAK